MNNNWSMTTLSNIAEDVRKLYEPKLSEHLNYIGLEHIEQHTLRLTGIGSSSDTQSTKKVFEKGDVLFGSLRAYFRKVVKPKFNGVCSTDITVLRAKPRFDQGFLFYFITNYAFIDYANNASSGTRMPRANWKVISQSEWSIPPLPTQQKIAVILSAYDDLIENNNKRIAILEELVQLIYKEWFVHFRFPGHEEVPMVDMGGNRIGEEDRLPAGWKKKKISEVCDRITSGGTPRTKEPSFWNGGIPWLSSGETRNTFIIDTEKTITPQGVENSSTKLAKAGSIVIASAGQGHTRGQTSFLMLDTYINQSVLNLSTKSVSNFYLFFNLSNRYDELRMASDSFSSRGSLTTKLIGSLDIIVPSKNIMGKFDQAVEPIVKLIVNLLYKNINLRKTRDLLLPRLISGQLDVSELAIDIGDLTH